MTFFLDLPTELVFNILTHLDLCSLLNCRTLCSGFRDLIDSSPELQYKVELVIAGQEDGGHYPLATRREILKQRQQRWDDLRWTKEQRVRMLHGGLWELYGNVLAQNTLNKSTIHFKQLPSKSRNIEGRDWSINVKEFRLRDFSIDPGQDLLILVEHPSWRQDDHYYRVHLRALSTGAPHPLARGTQTLTHAQEQEDRANYSIQTCGDVLAILIDCHTLNETEVMLWNWKTGQPLANIVSDDISSMSFLGEKYIMLGVVRTQFELEVLQPTLVVVDFMEEPPGRRGLDEVENAFTFHFPQMVETADAFNIEVRSDPAPIWKPASDLSVPFFTARHSRLYVITLLVHTGGNFARAVQLYALDSSFITQIEKVSGQNTAHFHWQTWGPQGTRMSAPEFAHSQTWVCYVYGTRYVTGRQSRQQRADSLYIYDFNQLALKWSTRNHESDTASSEMDIAVEKAVVEGKAITAPTRIVGDEIFQDEVVTRLGFRVQNMTMPSTRARPVMCSEDGIIVVNEGNGGEYCILTI